MIFLNIASNHHLVALADFTEFMSHLVLSSLAMLWKYAIVLKQNHSRSLKYSQHFSDKGISLKLNGQMNKKMLHLHLEIDNGFIRDDLTFRIVNFPFIGSNIPALPVYGAYISQLVRYSRACVQYRDFLDRAQLLT